jgi:long-chain fatty acid transport protein
VNEIAARGTATQGALSAEPEDASTIFYNPAGLTELSGTHVELDTVVLAPRVEYERPGLGTTENVSPIPGAAAFIASDAYAPVWIGLGVYAPFARAAEFERNPATSNLRHRTGLVRTDVVPAFAFRPHRNVSVGVGIVASNIRFQSEILGLKESARGYGFTANAGVLIDAPGRVRIGLTYRGAMSARLDGRGSFGGERGDFHAKLRFPATLGASVAWSPTPRWTLGVAYDRERWSYVESFRRDYDNPTLAAVGTTRFDPDDSGTLRFGVAYRPMDGHELRAGIARIGTAFPAENTTASAPDADVQSFGLGYARTWERARMSISYEYLRTEERTTQNMFFPGRYEIRANVVQLGFSYRFDTD